MKISLDSFLQLIRDNASSDSSALETFMRLSENQESISATDCRSGLTMFRDDLGVPGGMTDDHWERVLDHVMINAGATIKMETWMSYAQIVARTTRLCHIAQL